MVYYKDHLPGPGMLSGDSGGPVYTVIQSGERAGQIQIVGMHVASTSGHESGWYWPQRLINGRFNVLPIFAAIDRR